METFLQSSQTSNSNLQYMFQSYKNSPISYSYEHTQAAGMESSESESSTLAAELAQVLDMVRQLQAHIEQSPSEASELCRALAAKTHLSISRCIHMTAGSARPGPGPESPPSGSGSPRSDSDSDRAGHGFCKKRKAMAKTKTQVRVSSVADVGPLDDGFSWRKYGQKEILGAKYPRAYFRCTHRNTQSCLATKQVQRTDGDPLLFDVVYHGAHTCVQRAQSHSHRSPPIGAPMPPSRQEQSVPAFAAEGAWPDAMPFSFPSTPGVADTGGCGFPGGFASPFAARATSETPHCPIGSGCAGGLGEQSMAAELACADMDFMLGFEHDFLDAAGLF